MQSKYEKIHAHIVEACLTAETLTEVEKTLGLSTPSTHFRRYLKLNNIPMPCFLGQKAANRIALKSRKVLTLECLRQGTNYNRASIKKLLFKAGIKECKCEKCGWCEKRASDGATPLHLHHVNGDGLDNRVENLEILCPNCHSLTDNYAGKNKGA